jgi:phosphatidylserine/phosphatidylglycerophosphate/cardiolipin synthase-like enzyme
MKNIFNKTIYFFFIFIFILFSLEHAEEYISFHAQKTQNTQYQKEISQELTNFSLDQIEKIEDLSVHRTSDLNLLDQIVTEINTATSRIYLETYILTEKRIQEALKNAFNR